MTNLHSGVKMKISAGRPHNRNKSEVELEMVKHIDALIALAGLDNSEIATEEFADRLGVASEEARKRVARSHAGGLCLDCRWIIARQLQVPVGVIQTISPEENTRRKKK